MSARKKAGESGDHVVQPSLSETTRPPENPKQPTQGVEYTNRKGKTYYLHVGKTNKGNPRYHFSTEVSGELVKEIPEGYEIYENPNALVFLRKRQPKEISDDEFGILEHELNAHAEPSKYKIDVKGKVITIFWADQGDFQAMFLAAFAGVSQMQEFREKHMHYSPLFRFTLMDRQERLFIAERFCFRGSIDDWMHLISGGPASLQTLATRYVKHLGKESFYELI